MRLAVVRNRLALGCSPVGPVLVHPDKFGDPDNVEIGCTLHGKQTQRGGPTTLSSVSRS